MASFKIGRKRNLYREIYIVWYKSIQRKMKIALFEQNRNFHLRTFQMAIPILLKLNRQMQINRFYYGIFFEILAILKLFQEEGRYIDLY